MILAGIDEAGYGPLLGPLVVGCWAFELRDILAQTAPDAPIVCLWKLLAKVASRSRSKSGKKLHINDSKQVYSPSAGLKELERSLLCLLLASERPIASLDALLNHACPEALEDLAALPWYRPPADERFPVENKALGLKLFSNGVRNELDRAGVSMAWFSARVLSERRFNQMTAQTRNKASVLFTQAASHIDYLLKNFAGQGLIITCDRQGRREHYRALLRLMFEDWPLEILREKDGHCEYLLHHPSGAEASAPPVRLIFREKAESESMAVALASMLSKYLRETLMHRFNAFWRTFLPQIQPTAGYYTDGLRFLKDIDSQRKAWELRMSA